MPAPTPLVITQAEAETLGLLQKDTADLAQRHHVGAGGRDGNRLG